MTTLPGGTIERVNTIFCRWLGFDQEGLVGKLRVQDLLTVGCKIFHQTHWMPLLQMQQSVAEVQLEFVHREGAVLPALVNAVRRSEGGVSKGDYLAIFPAADRRTYERELLGARKQAEGLLASERAAQEALNEVLREREREAQHRALLAEQLIGIVSHDLRTPLNAVLLGAGLLRSTPGGAALQVRTIDRVLSAGNRAARLIDDLLDFTQAQLGGGLRVRREPVDLHALVTETLEELRLASAGRALVHQCQGDGMVSVDADRISQVVTNLVANALAYGASGQPVTVTTATDADGELFLEVSNVGEPIPPALLPFVFEPLRRGDRQLAQGSRSVGLGLFIVQQIVQAHAGRVTVESSRESGTRFSIRIPAP